MRYWPKVSSRMHRRLAMTSGFYPIQTFDMKPINPEQQQKTPRLRNAL